MNSRRNKETNQPQKTIHSSSPTWYFSCISLTETENSVIVQLRVLNRRLRKAENNSSSLMQASLSNLCINYIKNIKNNES